MSDVVILGAGISGHTAALHLSRLLGRQHRITVVSPNSNWNWIPSNIWVGVGQMTEEQVKEIIKAFSPGGKGYWHYHEKN